MAQTNPQNLSMEQAMAFAASPAGQKLIAMLQKSGNKDLTAAQRHAQAGDMEVLRPFLDIDETVIGQFVVGGHSPDEKIVPCLADAEGAVGVKRRFHCVFRSGFPAGQQAHS